MRLRARQLLFLAVAITSTIMAALTACEDDTTLTPVPRDGGQDGQADAQADALPGSGSDAADASADAANDATATDSGTDGDADISDADADT
jgi:hypothetical protein